MSRLNTALNESFQRAFSGEPSKARATDIVSAYTYTGADLFSNANTRVSSYPDDIFDCVQYMDKWIEFYENGRLIRSFDTKDYLGEEQLKYRLKLHISSGGMD